MRLLYITVPSFFDLEISLIRELSKLCEVRVLMYMAPVMRKRSAICLDSLSEKVEIIPALEYKQFEDYDKFIDRSKWFIVNNPDGSLRNSLRLVRYVKSFIKDYKPDIVHTPTDYIGHLFIQRYIVRHYPSLYTIHDAIPHRQSFYTRLKYWFVESSYSNFLILSELPSGATINKKVEKRQVHIYKSSLSTYDFLKSYDLKKNEYGEYLLFFGRIDAYKGVDVLLRSYRRFRTNYSNHVKLVIAGKGDITGDMSDFDDDVIIINRYITNEELATLINYAEAVVLPYKTMTQSGVLMSAFAFNKPVIITNVGDIPSLDIEGLCGFVAQPNDENSLYEALCRWRNTSDKVSLSQNIRDKYSEKGSLGWKKIAENMLETYISVINDFRK